MQIQQLVRVNLIVGTAWLRCRVNLFFQTAPVVLTCDATNHAANQPEVPPQQQHICSDNKSRFSTLRKLWRGSMLGLLPDAAAAASASAVGGGAVAAATA